MEQLSSFVVIYYPIEHFFLPYFDFSFHSTSNGPAFSQSECVIYLAQSGNKQSYRFGEEIFSDKRTCYSDDILGEITLHFSSKPICNHIFACYHYSKWQNR